jgi:curved DNA-binding protein CbpA
MNIVAVVVIAAATTVLVACENVDHYATLGVEKSATTADIRRAYRALAIALHPDKNGGDENAAK